MQPDICGMTAVGWYKEHLNGNGPVRLKSDECLLASGSEILFTTDLFWERPVANAFWLRLWEKTKSVETEGNLEMPEVLPGFVGEFSPVKVDHHMATTLPGLFAAGDICWSGSAWTGAVPPPGRMRGTGLMNAAWSACKAGEAAAECAAGHEVIPEINYAQVDELKQRIFAPLSRNKGLFALDLAMPRDDGLGQACSLLVARQPSFVRPTSPAAGKRQRVQRRNRVVRLPKAAVVHQEFDSLTGRQRIVEPAIGTYPEPTVGLFLGKVMPAQQAAFPERRKIDLLPSLASVQQVDQVFDQVLGHYPNTLCGVVG